MIATASTGDWIGRPSIINDGSKWIMVYRAGALHGWDADARVHIRFSTDEGANWTAENTFTDSNPVTGAPFAVEATCDPDTPTLVKAPNGNLLLLMGEKEEVYTRSSARQFRSTDAGATWSDEGSVADEVLCMDFVVIGTEIYGAAYSADDTNPGGAKATLWKSTNSGTTWVKVGDVTSWASDTVNVDETSVCNPSGNNLVMAMRSRGAVQRTYIRISNDLGATWGDVINITGSVGIIQRPRLRLDGSRIYMIGRLIYDADNDPERSVISYSDNGGVTWKTPFNLETADQTDCGYADLLKKSNADYYALSYRGTYAAATIYEYVVDVLT